MLFVRSCILIAALVFITSDLKGDSAGRTEGRVTVEYSAPTSITLNEPVTIQLMIHNGLRKRVNADLGPNRKGNFIFKIREPNGSSIRLPPLFIGGLAEIGKVSIDPGQTYSQKLLLDEWYKPAQPGDYKVEVNQRGPFKTDDGKSIAVHSEGELALRVGPRNAKVLKDLCGQLMENASRGPSARERADATLALSYIRDPIAVPYLGEVVKRGGAGSFIAVDGLVRIGNAQAVATLQSNLGTPDRQLRVRIEAALWEIKTGRRLTVED